MATKKERRIAILKDAIKQIKLNNIVADPGTVVNLSDNIDVYLDGDKDAKPLLIEFFKKKDDKKEPCYACARGSLLLCTVHKENDFLLSSFDDCGGSFRKNSITDERLLKLFSAKQIALMENAFEVDDYISDKEGDCMDDISYYSLNSEVLGNKLAKKSILFGGKYKDPNKRLLAIFKNAVKNEGIFKP